MTSDIKPRILCVGYLTVDLNSLSAIGHATRRLVVSSIERLRRMSNHALIVSLIILALGDPRIPVVTIRAVVRHLPSGLMPVHARASRSNARSWREENPAAWCPHVAAANADPLNNLRAFLDILAKLEIFLILVLTLVSLETNNLEGLLRPAVKVTPKSLASLAVVSLSP